MRGSVGPAEVPGELGLVLKELTDYKTGKVYMEFDSVAELFRKIDRTVPGGIGMNAQPNVVIIA